MYGPFADRVAGCYTAQHYSSTVTGLATNSQILIFHNIHSFALSTFPKNVLLTGLLLYSNFYFLLFALEEVLHSARFRQLHPAMQMRARLHTLRATPTLDTTIRVKSLLDNYSCRVAWNFVFRRNRVSSAQDRPADNSR